MRYEAAELYNIRELIADPERGEFQLSRVPATVRAQLNEGAQSAALMASGCEIRFNLVGEQATVWLRRGDPRLCDPVGVAEIWFGPFQAAYEYTPRMIGQEPTPVHITYPPQLAQLEALAAQQGMPFDPRLVRIVLPYDIPTSLVRIEGEIAPPRPEQTPEKKLLCYGSSITHGGNTIGPGDSYAQRLARGLGYDLIGMGFAGSAHLEPAIADYMAGELEWEIATLELGINVLGIWSPEAFASKVAAFLPRIAEPHPERWIFCTDLFTCLADIEGSSKVSAFRDAVREAVARLGLPRLVYLDGRNLLPDIRGLSSDLVHPSSMGMEQIAANLLRTIRVTTTPISSAS